MSTFSPAPVGLRRQPLRGAGRSGIVGTLDSPGLIPAPADTGAADRAAQLLNVLGVASDTVRAGTGLRITRELGDRRDEAALIAAEEARVAELQRRARRQEELQAEADELERGLAARDAAETLPTLLARIDRGEITAREGEDVRDFVTRFVNTETEGFSDVYAEAFRDRVAGRLIAGLEQQRTGLREQTKSDNLRVLANTLATGDRAGQVVAAARKIHPDLTDAEVFDHLVRPAASAAADGGDIETTEKILARGPQQYETEREAILNRARANRQKLDDLRREQNQQRIFGLINDQQFGTAEQTVHTMRKSGEITEQTADTMLGEIGAARNRMGQASNAELIRQETAAWRGSVAAQAASIMRSADITGGPSALPTGDVTFTDSSGREHTLSPSQVREMGVEKGMADIAAAYEGDPEQMLQQQAVFLAGNGATYAPWRTTMDTGASFMLVAGRRAGENGEAPPPPRNAVEGFELYRSLRAFAPHVAASHVGDQYELFYEMADLAMEIAGDGNTENALSLAAIAAQNETRIDDKAINSAIDDNATVKNWRDLGFDINPFSEGGIRNATDIEGKVRERARFYQSTMRGVSPKQAVKKAVESIKGSHARMNGYLVPARASIPQPTLETVSSFLAAGYAERFGQAEGVEASDITLLPVAGRDDLWMLVRSNGSVLENSFSATESNVLTSRQLLEMTHEANEWASRNGLRGSRREAYGDVFRIMQQPQDMRGQIP